MSNIPDAYPDYYDERIETMPRQDIERLQQGSLLQLLPYVYQRSALIRKVWDKAGISPDDIKSLQDFKDKAPFIDKDSLRDYRDQYNDPYGGIKCVEAPHLKGVGFTSGTTGDPTPLPYSASLSADQMRRDFWQMGLRPGDYYIFDLFTFREGPAAIHDDCGFRPICFQHSPTEIPRIIEAIERFKPKSIFTISTPMIMAFEEYAEVNNLDLKTVFSSCKTAVFGGEMPPPRIRKLLKEWDIEMFEITSLGDVSGSIDCQAHDGFHAWEDAALIECLDPFGDQPVAEGERGELVVTALRNDVAPLIRYRTDDLITLTSEACNCGRTHSRIKLIGRKGDELIINGTSILPKDIHPLVEQVEETQAALYQIIRTSREMDELRIRIGYNPKKLNRSKNELQTFLQQHLSSQLSIPVTVELALNADLLKFGPPHKIPRVTKQ